MSRNPSDTARTAFFLIAGLAAALHAWTPAPRPGFKLDTLVNSDVRVSYDSSGRFSDSSSYFTDWNSGSAIINSTRYEYEGASRRLLKRIHFYGTPENWYSGERTYDTGYVRRDSQGRDSCMDISGVVKGSWGSAGKTRSMISKPNVIRWDKLGRVVYDGTERTPMSYGYDDLGRITSDSAWYSTKMPTFRNIYRYDDAGRLIFRGDATDTVYFKYSPAGWRTYISYSQGKLEAWSTVEERGDTAMYSVFGTFAGLSFWYLKDAWGDTIEEGRANTDSGFKITFIRRDAITRDQDGNAVMVRSSKGETLASVLPDGETRYVWSHALPGTGIAHRGAGAQGKVARIEWCDLRGRVLASTDRPWETFNPQGKAGLASIVERRLTADGHLVSSRILLTR